MTAIKQTLARQILDSRGNPTIEVEMTLSNGIIASAAVPSGASTGKNEAVELRDGDPTYYGGKGVLKAVKNVTSMIGPKIMGLDSADQSYLDKALIDLDGTDNKRHLGANAILGVSMAAARAASFSLGIPLFQHLRNMIATEPTEFSLPMPMFNILNGGVHADSSLDFQEFMIAPVGAGSMHDAVRMASETYHALKALLKSRGYSTSIGDEGGFAPKLKSQEEAPELIIAAISSAGFKPGEDIAIALDPAASEFYEDGFYVLKKSNNRKMSSLEMIELWEKWIGAYPIISLEDGLAEDDWEGWQLLTAKLGKKVQLVGDDIFVTNPKIIRRAIDEKVANASLIKLNQIGTVTETIEAVLISHHAGYSTVISHRSGETWDDFMSDLAVGVDAKQLKSGAPVRGERVAKYNRLMKIEDLLGRRASFDWIKDKS